MLKQANDLLSGVSMGQASVLVTFCSPEFSTFCETRTYFEDNFYLVQNQPRA